MRINSKGQVTIPAELRHRLGFHPGDLVDFSVSGATVTISKNTRAASRGERTVERMRGLASTNLSTDELMSLLRDESAA